MADHDRRDFLKTSAALATASLLDAEMADARRAKPPTAHKPLHLVGVHAYTDQLSVHAGEKIRFHASSTFPYEFSVCRLGVNPDSPDGGEVLHSEKVKKPVAQPIHPGSYVLIDRNLPGDAPVESLLLETWVRLWHGKGRQAIVSQFDTSAAGFALFAEEDGAISFYLGHGGRFQQAYLHTTEAELLSKPEKEIAGNVPIAPAKWHHVVAGYHRGKKAIYVDGKKVGEWQSDVKARAGNSPLRLGAAGRDGLADFFLDGDLAMPVISRHGDAASRIAIEGYEEKGSQSSSRSGVWACWPLSEEIGDRIKDRTDNGFDGRIVNHGTWMIGGPSFNAGVGRFEDYDPAKDEERGHGLRLASDDLYDCRWQPTHEFTVPETARSGIYVGRFRFDKNGKEHLYHTLFVVKRPAKRPKASIAFLASTNSWKAYAGTPFAENWPGYEETCGHEYTNSPGNPPQFSCYWHHHAGQGTYQMGTRTPWPLAGPYVYHGPLEWKCSHLCHADRLTLSWLEKEGYDFNVYSDLDLHRDATILDGHKVLFIVGHSEYWSAEGMKAIERFCKNGGSIVCLSGNTMFWRVSFNEDGTIMECRKLDADAAHVHPSARGEAWHSHDGKRGGLMRECGWPAWKTLGLEWLSLHPVADPATGPYRVVNPEHFLFNKPHRMGLKKGDTFGRIGRDGYNPIGHEGDARVSFIASLSKGHVPPGATLPESDPEGIEVLAEGIAEWAKMPSGVPYDYFLRTIVAPEERAQVHIASEMIYWERRDGGRIFHAGSVCSGRGFENDPRFGRLFKNVLHHFGVPAPC